MASRKKMYLADNWVGGIDLKVEKDAGNLVWILTGKYKSSMQFWRDLSKLCGEAIKALESGEPAEVIE